LYEDICSLLVDLTFESTPVTGEPDHHLVDRNVVRTPSIFRIQDGIVNQIVGEIMKPIFT